MIYIFIADLQCFSCMDLNILESARTAESPEGPLYDNMVDVLYGGVKPPPCSQPALVTCPAGNTCGWLEAVAEGKCGFITLFIVDLLYMNHLRKPDYVNEQCSVVLPWCCIPTALICDFVPRNNIFYQQNDLLSFYDGHFDARYTFYPFGNFSDIFLSLLFLNLCPNK